MIIRRITFYFEFEVVEGFHEIFWQGDIKPTETKTTLTGIVARVENHEHKNKPNNKSLYYQFYNKIFTILY